MLKHGTTLAMFIIGDLMTVIGSIAIGQFHWHEHHWSRVVRYRIWH